jgi:hypothetical protein
LSIFSVATDQEAADDLEGLAKKHPSGAKASVDLSGFVARLKPCPFKTAHHRYLSTTLNSAAFQNPVNE